MSKYNALLSAKIAEEFGLNEDHVELSESAKKLNDIFREQPPSLDEFIYGKKYLDIGSDGVKLSEIQYDFIRHFEQVLFPETYALMAEEWGEYWKPVRFVNELVSQWGKGSGKDLCCQIAVARVANILLCLKKPQSYFGVPHNSHVHLMNVAATATQAHSAFFKPLRALIVSSPWFEDKFESGEPPGEMATTIRFVRHVELVSGHSDADNLEGKNLIAGIADEISAFPTLASSKGRTAPAKTADGLVNMLRSSATTRFEQTYKLAQISFPRYQGDAIQQATEDAVKSNERYGEKSTKFVSGPYATWDVNPRYDKYERIDMPGSKFGKIPNIPSYVEQYESDPVEARSKYECAPEKSSNPYFKDKAAIYSTFSKEVEYPPLQISYYFGADVDEGETRDGWQAKFELHGLAPKPGALYAIHADMAVNGDRAGLVMSHVRDYRMVTSGDVDGNEMVEQRPEVVVDFATAFEYDSTAKTPNGTVVAREIQIRWFRKLVSFLNDRGFFFGSVSMDGFQSVDSLQILHARGFEVSRVSVDRDDSCWKALRDVMYDGRLHAYRHALLTSELEALTRMPNNKVDHPMSGSKDIADALAASVTMAVTIGGQEEQSLDPYGGGTEDMSGPAPTSTASMAGAGFDGSGDHSWSGAFGSDSYSGGSFSFGSFGSSGGGSLW